MATVPTNGKFTLPALPYDYGALEPQLDAETMYIHHQKHHNTMVANLNAALADYPKLQSMNVAELLHGLSNLPSAIQTAVRNNAGGHANHSIWWATLSPKGGGSAGGALAAAINAKYGSFGSFQNSYNDVASRRFGSGWGWLSTDSKGTLYLASYPNQDSPYMEGLTPLLGVDVWEHAYYLKFRQKRAEFLSAWWNVINWSEVGRRYDLAIAK
ncbi:superoxide dismutase [Herpetosiphon sp. NSE202]|uniref:superoxide dismutase n=1 Tax=Herpetosiphon sp. NSE202 TaxID=3351349 RepID=UPI00362906CC